MHALNTEAFHQRYSLLETWLKEGMPSTLCAKKIELKSEAKEPLLEITHFKRVHLNFYGRLMLCNFFLQEWQDINLKWNKSDYGQIGDIRIPPKYIWKPDLLMYNRSLRSICNNSKDDSSLFFQC